MRGQTRLSVGISGGLWLAWLGVMAGATACRTTTPVSGLDAASGDHDATLGSVDATTIALPRSPSGTAPTHHGDPARSGNYREEPALAPAAVRQGFGPAAGFVRPALGDDIYGGILYLRSVTIDGQSHAVLYVNTQHNNVFAIDAQTGDILWQRNLGTPVTYSHCGNITPDGTISTPVIDLDSQTLFSLNFVTPEPGTYQLSALDLATGELRAGFPAPLAIPDSNGKTFDVNVQQQRGALTFLGGKVYAGFGGFAGDCNDYHGWVVGISTTDPTKQESYATPNGAGAGIWSVAGLSTDGSGNLFATTGNSVGHRVEDFGDAVMRFATQPGLAFSGAAVDYFIPSNWIFLNDGDHDLSVTPMPVPPQSGSLTPDLLLAAGKQGVVYLLNRDNLGGLSAGNGSNGTSGEGVFASALYEAFITAPALWESSSGTYAYLSGYGQQLGAGCSGHDGLTALKLTTDAEGVTSLATAWCSPSFFAGGSATVSSDGAAGGVVWVVAADDGVLYAFDALSGEQLFAGSDLGPTHRYIAATTIDGAVYVPTLQSIAKYAPQ